MVGSPYEDELLRVKLIFPETYPKHPPRAYFTEELFHPSVDADGLIGLNILDGPQRPSKFYNGKHYGTATMGSNWTEQTTVARILSTIQNMLEDPSDEDLDAVVLNEEAYTMAHREHDAYHDKVKQTMREKREYVRYTACEPLSSAKAQKARDEGMGADRLRQKYEKQKASLTAGGALNNGLETQAWVDTKASLAESPLYKKYAQLCNLARVPLSRVKRNMENDGLTPGEIKRFTDVYDPAVIHAGALSYEKDRVVQVEEEDPALMPHKHGMLG